jgi:DNA (cytosine-5)-methyltransferase 1
MDTKRKLTAVDLFCGCGGLSLGLEQAGFVVKVGIELDPLAAQTYRVNHAGTVLIQSDIRRVAAKTVKKACKLKKKRLSLLAGCPPCQGFSRIRRHSEDDPRNDLLFEFARMTRVLRPKTVLLENVPGLVNDRRFSLFVADLESCGYLCKWDILNAADFGVPQRRKRLILMGSRVGPIDLPQGNWRRRTVRDCIGSLEKPGETKDRLHKLHLNCTARIEKLIKRIPTDGGSRIALGKRRQLQCHKRLDGFRDVYGRMRWDDVAPTLTAGCFNPSKGRFLHPKQDRPISMREAAIIQTFPKYYRFPAKSGLVNIARLIGDALPPLFARRQAHYLAAHLIGPAH